jgi:hypothetical protein
MQYFCVGTVTGTRAGAGELRVSKLCRGSYFPTFLEPAAWPDPSQLYWNIATMETNSFRSAVYRVTPI